MSPELPSGSTSKGFPRVLLLGLDGATFSILRPLVARGVMPHLSRLLDISAQRVLMSTEPYVTAPAWTSLVTGKRPDTHGIFDWSREVSGQYSRRMLDATVRDDMAFWELLSQRKVASGSLNLPLSYPPDRNASFCVADMFSPSLQADFVHPRGLRHELLTMGYALDLRKKEYYQRGFGDFLTDLTEVMRARGQAIRQCLSRFPWQAAIVVFTETDRLQHAFWQHLQFDQPSHLDSPEQRLAEGFFRQLDEELGAVVRLVGPDTHLYIVSDHGFGVHKGAFYINDWLEAQGYLVLHKPSHRGISPTLEAQTERLRPLVRRLAKGALRRLYHPGLSSLRHSVEALPSGQLQRLGQQLNRVLETSLQQLQHESLQRLGEGLTPDAPSVDWSRTVAFADTPHGVSLNRVGRQVAGIVTETQAIELKKEIAARLQAVKDERTGTSIHAEVLERDARYWGRNTHLAPELVYTFADFGYSWRIGRLSSLTHGRALPQSFLAVDTEWETGTHRPEGILIASGPDIQPGILEEPAQIWDILPTMLYHLDQEIPPDLDGRVLRELMRDEVLNSREERWGGSPSIRPGRQVRGLNGEVLNGEGLNSEGLNSEGLFGEGSAGAPSQASDGLTSDHFTSPASGADTRAEEAVAEHLRALGYMA